MLRETIATLRELPSPLRFMLLGVFVNRAGTFIFPYMTLLLTKHLGYSGAQAGMVVAGYAVGSFLALLTGGQLTDRLGRKPTIMLSLVGSGVLAASMAFTASAWITTLLLLAFGFFGDLSRPAVQAIVADLLPSHQRARGFAALRVSVNIGWAMGLLFGGLLADHDRAVLFLGDAATTFACAALVWARVPNTGLPAALRASTPPVGLEPAGAPDPAPGDVGPPSWRDPVVLGAAGCTFSFAFLILVFTTILPLTITQSALLPIWVFGAVMALNGILVAIFEIPVATRMAGVRRLRVAALGLALAGIAASITCYILAPWWFAAVMVLITAGEILAVPQINAFLSDWSHPTQRGRTLGLVSSAWSVALLAATMVVLPLRDRLGDADLWPWIGLVAAPAVATLLLLDAVADRRERLRGRA